MPCACGAVLLSSLLGGLDFRDDDEGTGLLSLELDFVAGFDLVQHGGIFDSEYHGHAGHVQVFNHAMFQCDLFVFLVDLAHFAISHVRCCR